MARGMTNPEIGAELGISLDGAKYHVAELLGRLSLSTRKEIAEHMKRIAQEKPMTAEIVSIPILPVEDICEAADWYNRALALETTYLHEGADETEATNYAILQRGDLIVHLILDEPPPHSEPWTKAGVGRLYLKVRDVDQLFDEVRKSGIEVTRGLQTENWGARGFDLTDPSGNTVHIEQG